MEKYPKKSTKLNFVYCKTVEIQVTRDAVFQCARHFCGHVQEILQSSSMQLEEKKTALVFRAQELQAHLSRLIVDRLYRLESEV